MRMLGLAALLCVALAAVAFATKPDQADAEAALRDQVMLAVANRELGEGGSAAGDLALAACKLKPRECYDLLRAGIEAEFTDHVLYTRFRMSGFDLKTACYGAFGRFFCPGGLKKT